MAINCKTDAHTKSLNQEEVSNSKEYEDEYVQVEPRYLVMSAYSTARKVIQSDNALKIGRNKISESEKDKKVEESKNSDQQKANDSRKTWNIRYIALFVGLICLLPVVALTGL